MSIGDEATAGLRFMEDEAKAWTVGHKLWLIFAALIAVAAFVVWTQWPAKPTPEITTAAPEVHQADGSVIAERRPDPKPPAPRHILPKGAVEERRAQVVVAPASAASSVEVDLSLVRMPDNGRRVIASSPDGQIVSALDIPIEAGLVPPEPKKWAAGLAYSTQREMGVWLERDIGRLRLGAEVSKGAGSPRAELRVGVTF
jgi:hypothetical protein